LTCLAACQSYDPPPEIMTSNPVAGTVISDYSASLTVEFTEPIKQDSLVITLSKTRKDPEGNLLPWCPENDENENCNKLLSGVCTPAGGCSGAFLKIHDDLSGFTLRPDEDFTIGEYLLRIEAGLEDQDGNATGVPYDVSFFVSPVGQMGPTTFPGGVMFVFMNLVNPFEFNFEVYFHIQVNQETGEVWGGGCDGDLIDPEGDRIFDPSLWAANPTFLDGFKFVFDGLVQDVQVEDANGNLVDGYYFENKPAYIYCDAPQVEIFGGTFVATMVPNSQTGQLEVQGTFVSPETYIFDTPAHADPKLATGVMEGVVLTPDQYGSGAVWSDCADPDPGSITLPP